jgi:hypothetical protein
LCAPRAGEADPDVPRWASAVIAEYSRLGQRVQIRVAAVYPGLPGEVSALLHAGAATGRDALAVLPTASLAARTRALLPAFTGLEQPLDPDGHAVPGRRGQRLQVLVEGDDTPHPRGTVALIVVLAGPVRPGVTVGSASTHRRAASAKALAGWARQLAPGGTLVALCPPQPGGRPGSPGGSPARWPDVAKVAGLRYTQHLVLVHVPVMHDTFAPADPEHAGSGPFTEVHTDAFVLTAPTVSPISGATGQPVSNGAPTAPTAPDPDPDPIARRGCDRATPTGEPNPGHALERTGERNGEADAHA